MKSGLDSFPLDAALDGKMELILAEFGLAGFGAVVNLLMEIYGKEGYYLEWTEDAALLFALRSGSSAAFVSDIVSACLRRGIFDEEVFERRGVLTSREIQKRYFEAVSRRKEMEVDGDIEEESEAERGN